MISLKLNLCRDYHIKFSIFLLNWVENHFQELTEIYTEITNIYDFPTKITSKLQNWWKPQWQPVGECILGGWIDRRAWKESFWWNLAIAILSAQKSWLLGSLSRWCGTREGFNKTDWLLWRWGFMSGESKGEGGQWPCRTCGETFSVVIKLLRPVKLFTLHSPMLCRVCKEETW